MPVRLLGGLEEDACATLITQKVRTSLPTWARAGVRGARVFPISALTSLDPELELSAGFRKALNNLITYPHQPNAPLSRMIGIYFPEKLSLSDPVVIRMQKLFEINSRNLLVCVLEGERVRLTHGHCGGYHLEFPDHLAISGAADAAVPVVVDGAVYQVEKMEMPYQFLFASDRVINGGKSEVILTEFFQTLALDYHMNILSEWVRAARKFELQKISLDDSLFSDDQIILNRGALPGEPLVISNAFFTFYLHSNLWATAFNVAQILRSQKGRSKTTAIFNPRSWFEAEARKAVLTIPDGREFLLSGLPGICPGPIDDVIKCGNDLSGVMFNTISLEIKKKARRIKSK